MTLALAVFHKMYCLTSGPNRAKAGLPRAPFSQTITEKLKILCAQVCEQGHQHWLPGKFTEQAPQIAGNALAAIFESLCLT